MYSGTHPRLSAWAIPYPPAPPATLDTIKPMISCTAASCGNTDHDHFIGQNCRQCADGVVYNGLPLKQGRGTMGQFGLSQQRPNHCWTFDNQDPAENSCNRPTDPHVTVKCKGRGDPTKECAHQNKASDTLRCIAQLMKVER